MNINDIQVGKKYITKYLRNSVLLGIGMRELYTGEGFGTDEIFKEKHLVVIESFDKNDIGFMLQEGEDARDGLWESLICID